MRTCDTWAALYRHWPAGKQITIPGGQLIPQWDGKVPTASYYVDAPGVFQTGRTMGDLFDLLTVFLVFLIGRRLYGPQAGLLAAAFSAFAVTQIQIANFYIVEPFLVTFMTAMLYFSVVLMQQPGFWPALGAGLCLGFALACKVSVAPLALVIVAALVLRAAYRRHTRRLGPDPDVADPVGLRPATRAERDQTLGRALVRLLPLLLVAGRGHPRRLLHRRPLRLPALEPPARLLQFQRAAERRQPAGLPG